MSCWPSKLIDGKPNTLCEGEHFLDRTLSSRGAADFFSSKTLGCLRCHVSMHY